MTHQEYEHIVPRLRPRLKDIGRQFFGDEEMAEDIAQETLMRLWLLRDRIDPQTDIELIAHGDAQHDIELREEIKRLRKAISLLKPAEQRLFRMRHEAEMDLQQISAVTGIGTRSISAMLSTAKRKLQEILIKKGGLL